MLGGTGNFGARIVRALQGLPGIELFASARRPRPIIGASGVACVALDLGAENFEQRLRALRPDLVIHCIGPFQGQDYRVVRASLAAGAHYLDLADGRDFVAGFAAANDAAARAAGRWAVTGASTLPALSSAVVAQLKQGLQSLEDIDIAIAPGQRAPRGDATLAAVFSYLGRPVPVWEEGRWMRRWGWMGLRRIDFDFGRRWAALCDVPDLALWPAHEPGLRRMRFAAALEIGVQHHALWLLAGLRRIGVPIPMERWAVRLERCAKAFDTFAGDWGGMRVSVVGRNAEGARLRHTWQLTAPALNGPEIPCLAAILLARQWINAGASGLPVSGAMPCMGLLQLAQFDPEFARLQIRTRIIEEPAP
ncbi:MAG: hypothetical protein LBE59_02920 [Nevskiaceae bacterium]|nr:hypothetical protein [Nevskiaceae bacterium]